MALKRGPAGLFFFVLFRDGFLRRFFHRGFPGLPGGVDIGHQLFTGDGFLQQQILGHLVQQGPVLLQNGKGTVKGGIQQLLDLHIHPGGGILGAVHIGRAVQVAVLGGGRGHEAQIAAHAVLGDHVPGQ